MLSYVYYKRVPNIKKDSFIFDEVHKLKQEIETFKEQTKE